MLRCTQHGNIVLLEPDPYNYFWTRLNLLANAPSRRGWALRVALGTSRSWIKGYHVNERSWYSVTDEQLNIAASSNGSWFEHLDTATYYNVEVIPFADILDAAGITAKPALMKLDCERCEWGLAASWVGEALLGHALVGKAFERIPLRLSQVLGTRNTRPPFAKC
eukprot:TRINITY_DN29381_c0_g1_i12.p1 TRINITY_DN29381_c0_g1~~TRINITY_DN29381_c0_g1_i12.p1  ORF type:complete len:165 (+),score=11.52 TRINITY_DN29381_c0_g1_i12:510-1004(+)